MQKNTVFRVYAFIDGYFGLSLLNGTSELSSKYVTNNGMEQYIYTGIVLSISQTTHTKLFYADNTIQIYIDGFKLF